MATKDRGRFRTRVGGKSVSFPKGTPKKVVDDYERRVKLKLLGLHDDGPTVKDYAEHFKATYPTIRRREFSTRRKDFFSLRDHIVPRFGKRRLTEIEAADVLSFQADLLSRPMAPQSVNNVVSCLATMFRLAVLEGKAKYNPCASVPRVPRPKVRPQFWTPDEASQFLSYARVHAYRDYQIALLAICSGMRIGELQGLLGDCLNFEQGYVDVRRHYCTKQSDVVPGCKSGSEGKVPLPRMVLEALADKRGLAPDAKVFPDLYKERAYGKHVLRPLAVAAGVPPLTTHKLRHTFASHLVLGKVHPREIQALLRHKKGDSSDIYMHLAGDLRLGSTDCIANGLSDKAFSGGNVQNLRPSRV